MENHLIASKVCGDSHTKSGRPCQDAYVAKQLNEDTLLIAVADGHGSAACPFSQTGAELATQVFTSVMAALYTKYQNEEEKLIAYLDHEGTGAFAKTISSIWETAVKDRYEKDLAAATQADEEYPEFSTNLYGTTLLGLFLTKEYLFAYQLGDGDMTYVDASGTQSVVTAKKFLGTETYSLANKNSWKEVVTCLQRVELEENCPCLFMVSTDGFANSYVNDSEYLVSCKEYFEMIKEHGVDAVESNLTDWLLETSRIGCGDDITLVMAYLVGNN